MSTSSILYKDVAPGAAEAAVITSTGQDENSDVSTLVNDNDIPALATLEPNRWLLNGTFKLMPQTVAFWSDALSNEDGMFDNPASITVTFSEQYSSVGLTLIFDTETGEYCSAVNIKWYQGDTLKSDVDFTPNADTYFCSNQVTSYNKIVITLNQTSLPKRRARVNQIIFGIYRRFYMDELRSVKIVNETDLSMLNVPISTATWNLDSKDDVDFMFQLKQPVECWNNNSLIGVYYINSYSRSSDSLYSIDCHDAFGILDETPFDGGLYSDKSAKELVSEIIGSDFDVSFEVDDTTLTGLIQTGTKREAIQQILFAWGVCASTDGRNGIRLFTPSDDAIEIGTDRTYVGASIDTDSIVTEVRVTSHTYTEDSNGSIEAGGKKYSDTTAVYTVSNPDVTANDKQRVEEVTNATLISPSIAQSVAQRLYDYYLRRDTINAKFVWRDERLGDCVTQPTPWNTTVTGNLAKMTITLSNTIAVNGESVGRK